MWLDFALAGAAIITVFLIYVRTLAPSLLMGDCAELQTLSYTLGMTHPTGFPIYLLLGKLFTLLPFGDVHIGSTLCPPCLGLSYLDWFT